MRVSFNFFKHRMAEYGPLSQQGKTEAIGFFRPVTHCVENGYAADCLYIGLASQLPEESFTECIYILIEDQPLPDSYLGDSSLSYILLPGEHAGLDLHKIVQESLEAEIAVGAFSIELLDMLKRKINIQQILESSHRSIKWPMILFDLSMGVIAHVGCSRTCLEDKIRNGFVTDTFFHHIMDGENVSEDDGYNNIIRTAEWEGGKVWAGRIKLDGHPIAYLVLYADDADAAKKDIRIFDVLCSLLGLKIQNDWQYLPGITTPENAFLYSILGDTALSAQNIDDRAVRLNLRLYDRLHLIVLESRKDSRHIDELYLFHRKLQTLFPHKYILIKEQRITVLFDSNEAEPIQGELYRDFSRMLKGEGFLAAVGLEFNSLKDMRDNFDQTCICLDIALRAKSKDPIVFHKDLMVEHMLLTCSEHMDLRKTIHPAIAILRDTDSKSKTQLEETLFILIANHMNMAETAKKIHIHYNTLKYRVQRIEELTGLDLKDSNTTFQLSLSRRIMDLLSLFP